MSGSYQSPERHGGGPDVDDEIEAAVAELYLSGGALPDQRRVEFMRQQFREVYGTSGEGFPFANATAAREETSYNRKWREGMRIRLYRTKLDRAAGFALGTATVVVATGVMFNVVKINTKQLLAGTMGLIGVLMGAGVFESGRLGYLAQLNWNHIDDLGASLPAFIVRGHHEVHQAEQMMLRRARTKVGKPRRVMMVELWNGQRSAPGTEPSAAVEREIDSLVRTHPDCDVRTAVSATPKTWAQRADLLERRCGKMDQRFFQENPLQIDAILTDDEAILSFPRGKGDRGLALVFRSKGMVQELWDVLNSQVGDDTTARSFPIKSHDDIEKAKKWVHDNGRSVFPESSFED